MRARFLMLGFLVLLAPATTFALDAQCPPGWTEATRDSDLIIFYKDNPAAGARELLAYTEIAAPPSTVFKVVTDYTAYPSFMPYVKESTIVKQINATELVSYQHLSPPLVDDRDYVLAMKSTLGSAANGGVYKAAWTPTDDSLAPPRDGMVRVHVNTGSWTLEPIDGGAHTRVTYSLLTNPGGSIPRWAANKSNTIAIPSLFKAVRKRALAGK